MSNINCVTATNLLNSWLTAIGEETVVNSAACTVTVRNKRFSLGNAPGLKISAKDILSRNRKTALEAFWVATKALNLGTPTPFNRGHEPTSKNGELTKESYKKDPFTASIRASDFRRAPDPTSAQWAKYLPLAKKISKKFYYFNRYLCSNNCMDIDDIMSYAQCYLVNFCAKYERVDVDEVENIKLFYVYVTQRLNHDLRRVLNKTDWTKVAEAEKAFHGETLESYEVDLP